MGLADCYLERTYKSDARCRTVCFPRDGLSHALLSIVQSDLELLNRREPTCTSDEVDTSAALLSSNECMYDTPTQEASSLFTLSCTPPAWQELQE